jgi:rod shape-determining protein MreC
VRSPLWIELLMSKRPYYVACGAVLLLVLILQQLPERRARGVKLVLGGLFLPLFSLAGTVERAGSQAAEVLVPRGRLARQVTQLQAENQQLRFQLSQLQEAWRENTRLKQALGWQPIMPWQLKAGRVVGQDPANWWRMVHIDLGSREGIQPNQPVLTPDGLVGKVTEVGYGRSQVVLAGDPGCRFSAQVQETRDKGIVGPEESSFSHQLVNFTFVPTTAALKPGQLIVTSGDGGVFPKGIPVGQIVDVQTNESGPYLEARVRLLANLNRLEEVWVMLP